MAYGFPPFVSVFNKERFTDKLKILTAKSRVRRDLERGFWNVTLSMLTSHFLITNSRSFKGSVSFITTFSRMLKVDFPLELVAIKDTEFTDY